MIIALYIGAAVVMALGSLYFAGRSRDFRRAHSSYHREFCSISISPTFQSLCWVQVLSKHLRSALAAPLSISSFSCSVSILVSSGSQRVDDIGHVACQKANVKVSLDKIVRVDDSTG